MSRYAINGRDMLEAFLLGLDGREMVLYCNAKRLEREGQRVKPIKAQCRGCLKWTWTQPIAVYRPAFGRAMWVGEFCGLCIIWARLLRNLSRKDDSNVNSTNQGSTQASRKGP